MKCSDLQTKLALSSVPDGADGEMRDHLAVCPLCRQKNQEYREMVLSLGRLNRPDIPGGLKRDTILALRAERNGITRGRVPEWLQMRVMPLAVGLAASIAVTIGFLSVVSSGMLRPTVGVARNGVPAGLLASNTASGFRGDNVSSVLDPAYAYSGIPAINPRGALVALTRSMVRNGLKDDEVVVVADVFSDGVAQIAEVVEPSRSDKAVEELQKALRSDPGAAPFIPSKKVGSDGVRVILKFQTVNVNISESSDPGP